MSTQSEATHGSKLNNAETLLTHLNSFADYQPGIEEIKPAFLATLIADAKVNNQAVAANQQAYSAKVEYRQQLFKKDKDSLLALLSPIGAAVRFNLNKNSKAAKDISKMIAKIRGIKPAKDKKDPKDEQVSQSHRSYGSITQYFADLVTTLVSLKDEYKPSNPSTTVNNLNDKLQQATQSNNSVAKVYGKLKESRDDRGVQYHKLTDNTQRIKDAVKSQYLLGSTEYNLIKGLKI